MLPIGWALGLLSGSSFMVFSAAAVAYGLCLSLATLVLEELSFRRYREPADLLRLCRAAVLENFGLRQLHSWWRLVALVTWRGGRKRGGGAGGKSFWRAGGGGEAWRGGGGAGAVGVARGGFPCPVSISGCLPRKHGRHGGLRGASSVCQQRRLPSRALSALTSPSRYRRSRAAGGDSPPRRPPAGAPDHIRSTRRPRDGSVRPRAVDCLGGRRSRPG